MTSVNTNMSSIFAQNNLSNTQSAMQTSLQRLSSGYRINSAADDAAGLAISQKMISQIGGLTQASSNSQSAISMLQTADGAMAQTQSILQQMRTLAVQAASDSNTASDRLAIQSQVNGLTNEISNISNTTTFNTQNLLAGGLSSKFQIGAMQGQTLGLSIGAMDAQTLGVAGKLNIMGVSGTQSGGTGIGAAMNLGDGLTAQQYHLTTKVTYANSGGSALNVASTGVAATTGNYTGAFTGQVNTTFEIRVDSLGAGVNLSGMSGGMVAVSTDGGVTWGADQAYVSGMSLGNGISWNGGSGLGSAQVGDIMSAYFTPWSASLQLADSGGISVGSAVTVNNLATTATVGNVNTLQTMDVKFTQAGYSGISGVTSGTAIAFQSVQQLFSSGAVTSNGAVTVNATVLCGINVSSAGSAGAAITAIDKAIATVSAARSQMGALENNLTSTMANLQSTTTNLTAANSAIDDTDMAAEMSNFTKLQILSQAGTSMLSQANQSSQTILKLLQ